MRNPILLTDQLVESVSLVPVKLSVTENLTPLSTAELVLTPDMSLLPVRYFVQLYDHKGRLGIYRVASSRLDWNMQLLVSLEHGICTLEDCTGPEEAALSGSMRSILTAILSWQHDVKWQLGDVDVPDDKTYELDAGNQIALQALLDAVALAWGYGLEFDQTTAPWTLHLRKLPEEKTCECRLSRNVSSLGYAMDESEMCTRVTHSLLPDGYLDGPTADVHGIISRPLDADEDATAEEVAALAAEYLDAHKDPRISIEIDAVELGQLTGVDLDLFSLGAMCRVALEDESLATTKRIISIYHPDVYGAPEHVRLTISTQARSTAASLAGLRSSYQRSSRSNAQQFKYIREELDKIVIEAPTVELIARVTQLEEENGDQELQINEALIRLDAAEAAILLKADQTAYDELGARLSQAEIDIDGANAAISLKASQETVDALGERVSAAEIAIDGANSEIELKADKIDLQGYVTVEEFEAFEGSISDLWADELRTSYVSADNVIAGYGDFDDLVFGTINGNNYTDGSLTMGDVASATVLASGDINLAHSHAIVDNGDGSFSLGEVATTGGSFNIADTTYYKDGVSAAKTEGANSVTLTSAGWVNGTNIVKASNGKQHTVNLPSFSTSGGTSWSSEHTTIVYFYTDSVSSPLQSATVDASSVYDSGYDAGYAAGYAAAKAGVTVECGVSSWSNPAQYYARVSVFANAKLDGETIASNSATSSQNISGYV